MPRHKSATVGKLHVGDVIEILEPIKGSTKWLKAEVIEPERIRVRVLYDMIWAGCELMYGGHGFRRMRKIQKERR